MASISGPIASIIGIMTSVSGPMASTSSRLARIGGQMKNISRHSAETYYSGDKMTL